MNSKCFVCEQQLLTCLVSIRCYTRRGRTTWRNMPRRKGDGWLSLFIVGKRQRMKLIQHRMVMALCSNCVITATQIYRWPLEFLLSVDSCWTCGCRHTSVGTPTTLERILVHCNFPEEKLCKRRKRTERALVQQFHWNFSQLKAMRKKE